MSLVRRILKHGFLIAIVIAAGMAYYYRAQLFPNLYERFHRHFPQVAERLADRWHQTTEQAGKTAAGKGGAALVRRQLSPAGDTEPGGAPAPAMAVATAPGDETAASTTPAATPTPGPETATTTGAQEETATRSGASAAAPNPVPVPGQAVAGGEATQTAAASTPAESSPATATTNAGSEPAPVFRPLDEEAEETGQATEGAPGAAPGSEAPASSAENTAAGQAPSQPADRVATTGAAAAGNTTSQPADTALPTTASAEGNTASQPAEKSATTGNAAPRPSEPVTGTSEPATTAAATPSKASGSVRVVKRQNKPPTQATAPQTPGSTKDTVTKESAPAAAGHSATPAADPATLLAQARAAFWQNRLQEAIHDYQALARLRADDPRPWGELGNIYYAMGRDQDAAVAYFEAAKRLIERHETGPAYPLLTLLQQMDPDRAQALQRLLDQTGAAP